MTQQVLENAPAPGSDEWKKTVTASKVAAMLRNHETGEYLGIDYASAFETWHTMHGTWDKPISDDLIEFFTECHQAEVWAISMWATENPEWEISPVKQSPHGYLTAEVPFTDTSLPFPNIATVDAVATHKETGEKLILEVKRPRSFYGVRTNWKVQHNTQMAISGIHKGVMLIAPKYGEKQFLETEFDPELWEWTLKDIQHFMTLEEAPDMAGCENAQTILAGHHPTPDGELKLNEDDMSELLAAWQNLADAEAHAKRLENIMAERLGDNAKATFNGVTVVSRSAGRFAQSRIPTEHKAVLKDEKYMTKKFDDKKLKKAMPDVWQQAVGAGGYLFQRASFTNK